MHGWEMAGCSLLSLVSHQQGIMGNIGWYRTRVIGMIGHAAIIPIGTIALADANRSCGPPKPGRRLLSGVRRCRRRSAGGPSEPDGVAAACPGGPNINRAPIRDSRATRRMTTCSELRWKAHISFWAKTDMPQKMTSFWVLL